MTRSACASTKHQDYDCLVYAGINKKFRHAMWCKPCQIKYQERIDNRKENK